MTTFKKAYQVFKNAKHLTMFLSWIKKQKTKTNKNQQKTNAADA